MNELSYIDLLVKLHNSVQSDNIPERERAKILKKIYDLERMLWKYSS